MSANFCHDLTGFQTKPTFLDLTSPKRVKLERRKSTTVKIFTVGSKSFVTSFQLAGIPGKISENPQNTLEEIKTLTDDSDVGLVLVSDDITESISDELTKLRAEKSTLVFALPAAGSKKIEIDYRVMLKKILGV